MTIETTTPRRSLLARAILILAMMGGAMSALPTYAWDGDRERCWDRHRQRDYRYHYDHRYQHGWRHPNSGHRVYVTPVYGYPPEYHVHHHYHHWDERHHHDRGRDALVVIGGAVLLHEILHH